MAKKPDLVTRYEVIAQEDPSTGDLILPIPQPVLDRLNWKEGDSLDISLDKDGKIYLKKI
jgi:AbrB family looped-hinge helix DNA binding protein